MTRVGEATVTPGAGFLHSSLWPPFMGGGVGSAQHPFWPASTPLGGGTIHASDFLLLIATVQNLELQGSHAQIFSEQRVFPSSSHDLLPLLLSSHDVFSGLGLATLTSLSYLVPCMLYSHYLSIFLKCL